MGGLSGKGGGAGRCWGRTEVRWRGGYSLCVPDSPAVVCDCGLSLEASASLLSSLGVRLGEWGWEGVSSLGGERDAAGVGGGCAGLPHHTNSRPVDKPLSCVQALKPWSPVLFPRKDSTLTSNLKLKCGMERGADGARGDWGPLEHPSVPSLPPESK